MPDFNIDIAIACADPIAPAAPAPGGGLPADIDDLISDLERTGNGLGNRLRARHAQPAPAAAAPGAAPSRVDAEAVRAAAQVVLKAIDDLISESEGVYGLHRNGDPAPWSELTEGGQYEGWLGSIETLRAALASAGPDGEGWLPIETAPKDGTSLLLACADWAHSTMLGKPVPVKVGGWGHGWEVFGASWKPTHWRPLPVPPSVQPDRGQA